MFFLFPSPFSEKAFEPLHAYARLDTCVTVVDLYNILHILGGDQDAPGERERLLGDDHKEQQQQKEALANGEDLWSDDAGGELELMEKKPASLYQLLVDQLEFANVILLNKVDLIHPNDPEARHRQVMQVGRLVRKFNPDAELLVPGYQFDFAGAPSGFKPADENAKPAGGRLTKSKFGDFDVGQVINTCKFNMAKAQMGAGWINELQKDIQGVGHNPETEEYGIGSFVWRTSQENPRPFHPQRLSDALHGFGRLPESAKRAAGLSSVEKEESVKDNAKVHEGDVREDGTTVLKETGPFMGVMRSKGTLWLAYAHAVNVDFHTAGRQLSLGAGNPFLDAIPRKYWGGEATHQFKQAMLQGQWHCNANGQRGYEFGDRRSVLVIIGVEMDADRKRTITEALNDALLTDEEMADGIKAFYELEKRSGDHAGDDKDDENTAIRRHPWRCYEDPFFGGQGPEKMWELKFNV